MSYLDIASGNLSFLQHLPTHFKFKGMQVSKTWNFYCSLFYKTTIKYFFKRNIYSHIPSNYIVEIANTFKKTLNHSRKECWTFRVKVRLHECVFFLFYIRKDAGESLFSMSCKIQFITLCSLWNYKILFSQYLNAILTFFVIHFYC